MEKKKPGRKPYTVRNTKIVRMYESGTWTMARLAEHFEITKQRVSQIVQGSR